MARLQFCDYHNMVAILEKSEHNVDFHPIVDFVEAFPLRYALVVKPTVYVSHIRQFWSTARIETTEEGTKILVTVDGILRTVTESSLRRNIKLQYEEGISSLPDAELFENLTMMGYNISPNQKFTFQKDEPTSPLRDVSEGEACPTDSGFKADQDRANIAKSSTLPYDSTPMLTSPAADEGKLEINRLKARVKLLEDREGVAAERSRDDALIKGRNLDKGEATAERVSDDTEDIATVLTSMDAATVLASGVAEVPTGSGSIPTAGPPAAEVSTSSDVIPTAGLIYATATVVTPYTRRKGKETMVESETPKKKKIQEQMDIQMARQLEEEMERDAQRMNEQIARDAEIARIHAEEELQIMIDGLNKINETVAKYLQEYHQFAIELPLEKRIELISDLVRYQDNYAKVYKFQTQQRKPWSKKQKRDYYMAVIKSNLGWEVKDFRGMTFEEIEAKFTTVWKQLEDFIPIGSKEEAERFKRKGIRFEQESVKKLKTSEKVPEEVKSPDEVPEEKVKEMMQLVPIEEHLNREDFNQLWALVKESLNIRPASSEKAMELWVELKRLYEPDNEDQLWTHTQNLMHALVEWRLYNTCGIHHVKSKDKEIFMLVEKDYPLRKGLGRIVGNKMHKAFPLPVTDFPLPGEVLTANEESSHCLKKREATAVKIALLLKSRRN
nr:hypothetical protein [Tanacetum cinerariifolium]